jgi:hypothetical protein
MANYVKSTNFAGKDSLPTGDPLKVVKGTEIDVEFNAIATAVTSKADLASPTFTGTPFAATASPGTATTQLATTAFVQAALQALHPVGSIYINATNSANPSTYFGFGTWVAFGAGRVPVGFNAADPLFDTAEETGGSKNAIVVSHTHTFSATTSENGAHTHTALLGTDTSDAGPKFRGGGSSATSGTGVTASAGDHQHTVSGTTSSTGSSGTNANLQPYITVYMWKRVS